MEPSFVRSRSRIDLAALAASEIVSRASQATLYPGAEDPPPPRPTLVSDAKQPLGPLQDPGKSKQVEETADEYYHRIEFALPAFILIIWMTATVALTYLTKWALSPERRVDEDFKFQKHGVGFSFPTFYTLVTTVASGLGCTLILALQSKTRSLGVQQFRQSWFGIVATAALSILGIWASDVAMISIGVTLNQIIKATMPMPTMVFGYVIERKTYSWQMIAAVVLLVCGAALAVPLSSPDATPYGLVMAAISTVAAAGCISVKAQLMSNSRVNGLTPLVLLWYSSVISIPVLLLLTIPEYYAVRTYCRERTVEALTIILASSALAFVVNLFGNTLTKVTSALTVTIASSTKQIGIILVSGIFLEHTFQAALNWIGVLIFISALITYAILSYNRELAARRLAGTPVTLQKVVGSVAGKGSMEKGIVADGVTNAEVAARASEKTPLKATPA